MFSQEVDFDSQNYHTSVSQRFASPQLREDDENEGNFNNKDVSLLSDAFARCIVQASIAMGGEEVGYDSHVNASQIVASQQQKRQKELPARSTFSDFEIALAHYCDGTWHTQQYLSSSSADEKRRHSLLAAQSFQQSLDQDQHFAFSHYGAGLIKLLEQKHSESFYHARLALLKMGSHAPNMVRFLLGISAFHLDRIDISEKCFNRISSISGGTDPLGHIGNFLISIRRRDVVGIAEALLELQQSLPQLPLELIQKSADMIYLQCWPTPSEQQQQQQQKFNTNAIRQKISQVAPSLLIVIEQSRHHSSCTAELGAYADFQEGRLRAALAVHAASDASAGLIDKDEMAKAQRLLYSASRHVVPAIPHLVRATYHALGKECALTEALQGFNRMAKLGLVPFRELFEMTTALLAVNNQPEGAARMAKQLVDTVGLANSEAWFNASFVNRLDQQTSYDQIRQAVKIEETIKDSAAAGAGVPLVCTSGEDEAKININIASLAPKYTFQGEEDPADPLNMLLRAGSTEKVGSIGANTDLKKLLTPEGIPDEAPRSELLPLIFNFALVNESRNKRLEAVRIYTALVKWFPHEPAPFFRLANIALENGDVWTCIKWMQLCIAIVKPEDRAQCFSMMARALASSGISGNAAAYKLLTSRDGKSVLEASSHQQRAVLYACTAACLAHDAQSGQHVQVKAHLALQLFRQSLKFDPYSSAAAHGIACCVALLGASEQSSTILERIVSERCPDVGITKFAAENLFNAYITTSSHRQALRMEQLRQEAYPAAPISRDRSNAIICALVLTDRPKEAVDRVIALVNEYPRHALTNFTGVLVVMAYVLSSVEAMQMPATEEEASAMSALLDNAMKWAGLATQLKDRPDATDFVRRLVSYIKKLDLHQVIHRFVVRAQREVDELLNWQDEWRAENTQRTRDAEDRRRLQQENEATQRAQDASFDERLMHDQQRTMELRAHLTSSFTQLSALQQQQQQPQLGETELEYDESDLRRMAALTTGGGTAMLTEQEQVDEQLSYFDVGVNRGAGGRRERERDNEQEEGGHDDAFSVADSINAVAEVAQHEHHHPGSVPPPAPQ